jgi:hydroxymethylpyrimidine/phosphomethylpyrimidine kinase
MMACATPSRTWRLSLFAWLNDSIAAAVFESACGTHLTMQIALTIAGSDPSGGAGLQADLKTFHQHGVYGMAVVSVLTVQSTRGVRHVEPVSATLLEAQLDHLLADIPPHAAKTGALGSSELVEVVAAKFRKVAFPLVVDPVMVSKHGHSLVTSSAIETIRTQLLPVSFLITPNAHEAAALTGRTVETVEDAVDAAKALSHLGAQHVLVKGGHLLGDAVDILVSNERVEQFVAPRIDTLHTHGTGCTFSAAIAACLAKGHSVVSAVRLAKIWLTKAIASAPHIGHGVGPLNHFAPVSSED